MSTATWIAFGCNLVAVLLTLGVGITYVTRKEFMPFHCVALGRAWSELEPPLRTVLLALIKGIGGYGLALALAQLIILLIPFRHGAVWALWAVPVVGLVLCSFSFYALTLLTKGTSANPPYVVPLSAGFLYLAGLCVAFL